jgi:hypothetical protein
MEKIKTLNLKFSWLHKNTRLVKIGGKKILEDLRILQNVIEKSFINLGVLPLVKINIRISDTPCILFYL